jgi:glyoxylase-like metal-dependent hydrolase (beta-lactamase superfamily II)
VPDRFPCIAPTDATRTRYDEIPACREGLYDLGNRLFAWLVPNGSWGESNSGLIVGDREALLVDTLWDVKHTRAMLAAMEPTLDGVPLKYLVNTHADGDHCWGNQLLPSAEAITSKGAYEEMARLAPTSMVLLGRVGRTVGRLPIFGLNKAGYWFRAFVAPYDFRGIRPTRPRRQFTGEITLWVGGRVVELIEVAPAHTAGDLLVHVPDAQTLFCGDIVFIGSTPVMWAGPASNIVAALDRILAMDVDVIVPGHGPVTDKAGVAQVKAYWEFVEAQTRQRFDAGMHAERAAREIALSPEFARQPFATWNSPERIMVNTHTQYRHYAGRTGHPGKYRTLNIMRKQALLAQEMSDAQPLVMRRP